MKKQTDPSIKAHLLRSGLILLSLLAVCLIPFALARNFNGRTTSATPSKQTQRTLTFADRVAYQRAISLAIRKRITDTLVETTDLVRHRSVVSEKFLNFFQNVAPEISEKRVKI